VRGRRQPPLRRREHADRRDQPRELPHQQGEQKARQLEGGAEQPDGGEGEERGHQRDEVDHDDGPEPQGCHQHPAPELLGDEGTDDQTEEERPGPREQPGGPGGEAPQCRPDQRHHRGDALQSGADVGLAPLEDGQRITDQAARDRVGEDDAAVHHREHAEPGGPERVDRDHLQQEARQPLDELGGEGARDVAAPTELRLDTHEEQFSLIEGKDRVMPSRDGGITDLTRAPGRELAVGAGVGGSEARPYGSGPARRLSTLRIAAGPVHEPEV
jgi:hypothetical protein